MLQSRLDIRRRVSWSAVLPLGLLALAIVLAVFLRTYQADMSELKMDEAGWLTIGSALLDHGKIPQIGSVDPNTLNTIGFHIPPLMGDVMAIPLLVSRDAVFATMFIALLNVVAVVLLFGLTREYFGTLEGSFAALFYATGTCAIIFSRKIWSNYLLAPVAILFFFCLFKLFVDGKKIYLAPALFLLSPLRLLAFGKRFPPLASCPRIFYVLYISVEARLLY